MKKTIKTTFGSALAVILLSSGVLCQTLHAQSVIVGPGTATLADAFGVDTGPEALLVTYEVTQNGPIYTYLFQVSNPAGDVLLNNDGTTTSTPEIVDAFSVAFDTTILGAYIPGTQAGGTSDQNNGTSGLFWSFTAVPAGSSSPVLQFQSDLPPTWGNANAQDANPPSPWSSNPFGQQVPVPGTVPEPATTVLLALGGLLLPIRSMLFRFTRK